ncbi:hypothetical protein REPUB_Repub10bG0046100 [Reevesia pubescens]
MQAFIHGLDDKVSFGVKSGLQTQESISEQGRKKCLAMCDKEAVARLEKYFIGTTIGNLDIDSLLENFKIEGYIGVSVRKLLGNKVVIDLEELEDSFAFDNWNSTWLSDWFSNLQPWSMDHNSYVRTTWLKYFGVPLHLWNHGSFRNLASLWGDFIAIDGNTLAMDDCSFAAVLITTKHLQKIDETIDMVCDDKVLFVRVSGNKL